MHLAFIRTLSRAYVPSPNCIELSWFFIQPAVCNIFSQPPPSLRRMYDLLRDCCFWLTVKLLWTCIFWHFPFLCVFFDFLLLSWKLFCTFFCLLLEQFSVKWFSFCRLLENNELTHISSWVVCDLLEIFWVTLTWLSLTRRWHFDLACNCQ